MAKLKEFSFEEVKKHNKPDDLWVVIHDKVYDLSKFANEHPGGDTVLHEQAGDYATEPFEDVGHSDDAREMMKDYLVGVIAPADKEKKSKFTSSFTLKNSANDLGAWTGLLIPFGVVVAALIIYKLYM